MYQWRPVVVLLGVVACESGEFPTAQQPASPPPRPSATVVASAAPTNDPHQRAETILARASDIRAKAEAAVKLEGSSQAEQVRRATRACAFLKQACIELAKQNSQRSVVGATAGLAEYLTQIVAPYIFSHSHGSPLPMDLRPILGAEQDLGFADQLAEKAMTEAKTVADARAAEEQKIQAERAAVETAAAACDAAPTTCKPKCDAGEAAYCFVFAASLQKGNPPKLTEAKTVMQKACTLGMQSGCKAVTLIDKDIQAAAARIDGLWSDVTEAGDDLARKRHQVAVVSQIANNPRMIQSVRTMQTINAAIVVEKYCPAKKAFIQGVNAAEFQTRATKHCRDDAPTGQGLSGAEITLTADCNAVYATACP